MISIIIPIYNTQKYLNECIESVLSQSYTDFELILINDASTDDSLNTCYKYANLDKRISVINNETRQGAAKCRNIGIYMSTREYICFVDSDDFIKMNMIQLMWNAMQETQADISMCNVEVLYRRDKSVDIMRGQGQKHITKTITKDEALQLMMKNAKVNFYIFNKLFNKSLFRKIKFAEDVVCEDIATIYRLMDKTQEVAYVDDTLYYHCMRKNSKSNQIHEDHELDIIKVCEDMTLFMDEYYPHLNLDMANKYMSVCIEFLNNLAFEPKDNMILEYINVVSLKIKELKQIVNFEETYSRQQKFIINSIINNPLRYLSYYKMLRKVYKLED